MLPVVKVVFNALLGQGFGNGFTYAGGGACNQSDVIEHLIEHLNKSEHVLDYALYSRIDVEFNKIIL